MFKSGWLLIRILFEFFPIPEKNILTSFVDSFTFKKILLLLKKRINTSSLVQTILVTASAMPTALEIKQMPNAGGIGKTALDGIEIAFFGRF